MLTSLFRRLRQARVALVLAAAWIAGAFFAALFVINLAQIVMRQFTGGWTWVGDLNTILFSWMVMLGAAAAYGRNEHIATSFLVERVPDALGRPTAYLVRAIELLLGFILIVAGLSVAQTRMDLPYVQLGVPTGWTYLAIPVFGALIVFFGLVTRPRTPTVLEQVQPVEPTTRGESLA